MYAIMEQVGYACITILMISFTVLTLEVIWHIRHDADEED